MNVNRFAPAVPATSKPPRSGTVNTQIFRSTAPPPSFGHLPRFTRATLNETVASVDSV